MLEHGAYTLLIDACYDRERFPSKDEAIEWCWARTPDEIAAVEFVLARFFTLGDNTYTQERIAEELAKYHESAVRNSKIATEREAKRTKRARSVNGASPAVHEAPPNQEPITNNPLTPKGGGKRFEEFWTAWPKNDRKQDKVKCARKWKSESLDDLADRILSDIAVKAKTEKWRGGFVEAPLVYLNGRRWEDGVEASGQLGIPDHMAGAI